MAVFKEDFKRCECGCPTFVEKTLLTLHENVDKYKREYKTVTLPDNLMEKEVVYVCNDCGQRLDV